MCMLKRSSGTGQAMRSYGWTDNEDFVTFIYCDTTTSTKLITFPRPKYQARVVTNNVTGKRKLVRKYVCSMKTVDGFVMNEYFPACMYFSEKFVCNFKVIFVQLCISKHETTGIISINPRCSS